MMYRMLGLGARELLYGRAEIARELPDRLAAVTADQVRAAAGALRASGRAVLLVEPATHQPEEQDMTDCRAPVPRSRSAAPTPGRGRCPRSARPARSRCPTRGTHVAERAAGAGRPPARGADGRAAAAGAVRRRRRRTTPRSPSCWRPRCSPAPRPGTGWRSTTSWPQSAPTSGVSVDPERLWISGSGLAAGLAELLERAGRRAHRGDPPRRRGGPRARAARRADHRGPGAAAHHRPGGAAAQAVRRPPDHPGDAASRGGRRGGHRRAGARAAGGRRWCRADRS